MKGYKIILAFLCVIAPFQAHGMQWSKELVKRYATGENAGKCADYIHKGATGLSNLIYFGFPLAANLSELYKKNTDSFNVDFERDQKIRAILKELNYPEKITKNVKIKFGNQYESCNDTIYVPPVPLSEKDEVSSIAHEGAHILNKDFLKGAILFPSIFVGTHLLGKYISKPINRWLYHQVPSNSLTYTLLKLEQSCFKLTIGLATKIGIAVLPIILFKRNYEYQADMEAIKRIKDPEVLELAAKDYSNLVEMHEETRPYDFPKALWEFNIDPAHPNYETRAAYFQKAADELREKQQLEQENKESL